MLFSGCKKPESNNETELRIRAASGSTLRMESLLKEERAPLFDIRDYGAIDQGDAVNNTKAINEAIEAAHALGGGTVIVPEGEYRTYTIHLLSDVNFRIEKNAVLGAALPDPKTEGANYDEPEMNRFAGLQDHAHTYFANSLFYANGQKNILIYGEGLVDGSCLDENGNRMQVLSGSDPAEPLVRNENGHDGIWFGNKGFALVNSNCQRQS